MSGPNRTEPCNPEVAPDENEIPLLVKYLGSRMDSVHYRIDVLMGEMTPILDLDAEVASLSDVAAVPKRTKTALGSQLTGILDEISRAEARLIEIANRVEL